MGMNFINRSFLRLPANWEDMKKNSKQEYTPQQLTPQPKPVKQPGNMQPKYPTPEVNLQDLLKNIDNPDIPKFS